MYIRYLVVYFSKDGNFYDTNMEYKNEKLGKEAVDLKLGNWKNFDTIAIQLYKNTYDSVSDERIDCELVYEVLV